MIFFAAQISLGWNKFRSGTQNIFNLVPKILETSRSTQKFIMICSKHHQPEVVITAGSIRSIRSSAADRTRQVQHNEELRQLRSQARWVTGPHEPGKGTSLVDVGYVGIVESGGSVLKLQKTYEVEWQFLYIPIKLGKSIGNDVNMFEVLQTQKVEMFGFTN